MDCVESLATDAAILNSIIWHGYTLGSRWSEKLRGQIPEIVLSIVRNASMTLGDSRLLAKYEIPSATPRWNAETLARFISRIIEANSSLICWMWSRSAKDRHLTRSPFLLVISVLIKPIHYETPRADTGIATHSWLYRQDSPDISRGPDLLRENCTSEMLKKISYL